jgi:exosortase
MSESVKAAPLVVRQPSGLVWGMRPWQGLALLLMLALLYANILARLFNQWMNDKNSAHGIFVPAFAALVLWNTREKLKSISPAPSWSGLPILIFGLIILMLGEYGAELFLARVSLLLVIAGFIVMFRGWPMFRAVLFPWAFLILMIPIPMIIFQKITFPLQLVASKLASTALPSLGVVVNREGNVIKLASMSLEVVTACSGIRSLLSLITLSIIYGYLLEERTWVRVLLVVAAIPIAVVANSFRVIGTGLVVQYWDPDKAEGFFHLFEGWLIFVVSLILLFALHGLVIRICKAREARLV